MFATRRAIVAAAPTHSAAGFQAACPPGEGLPGGAMGAIASLTCAAIAAGGLGNSHLVACEATELLLEVCPYLRRITCHLGSWHVNHAYMRRCFEGSTTNIRWRMALRAVVQGAAMCCTHKFRIPVQSSRSCGFVLRSCWAICRYTEVSKSIVLRTRLLFHLRRGQTS